MQSLPFLVGSAVAGAVLFANVVPLSGQQFFGEDLGSRAPVSTPTNSTGAYGDFLSNLGWSATEDFESSSSLPGGAGEIVSSGSLNVNNASDRDATRNHRYAVSGSSFLDFTSGEFTINFASPVHAFGFYGMDVGDFGDELFVTYTRASSATETISVPNARGARYSGSMFFFGLIDATDAFTSVVFRKTGPKDVFAFDDFVIGNITQPSVIQASTVTPEPVSMALLGTGLAGLALIRGRRRKRSETFA